MPLVPERLLQSFSSEKSGGTSCSAVGRIFFALSRLPLLQLPEPLTGKTVSLDDSAGAQATLIMFICNHCPFVIHLERAIVEMVSTGSLHLICWEPRSNPAF